MDTLSKYDKQGLESEKIKAELCSNPLDKKCFCCGKQAYYSIFEHDGIFYVGGLTRGVNGVSQPICKRCHEIFLWLDVPITKIVTFVIKLFKL